MKKRLLSLLLAMVLVVGLLPAAALAAGEETITVYLTVSDRGVLARDKNDAVMARRPVTVKDLNKDGKYTYDEALQAAHETYLTAADYNAPSGFVSKVWGVENNYGYLFHCNDAAIPNGVGVDTVAKNDVLAVSIMVDTTTWSDQYVFFDAGTREATAGEVVELTLKTTGGMMAPVNPAAPLSGVSIGTWENGAFVPAQITTDEAGKAALAFPTAGTYYVTARGSAPMNAPVCVVTVTGEMTEAQQKERVDADAAALTFDTIKNENTAADQVTGALTLPGRGANGLAAITWESDNAAINAETGAVTRPAAGEADAVVQLTATVTLGNQTAQKVLTVTVPALEEAQILAELQKAAEALTAEALAPVEFTGDEEETGYYPMDSAVQDTNLVTKAQALADAAAEGVTVTVKTSENAAVAADGAITYGAAQVSGNVTFLLTLSGLTKEVPAAITVPAHAVTKAELLAAEGLTFETFKGENADADHVLSQLPLPAAYGTEDGMYEAKVTWTSDKPAVIAIPGYASNDIFKTTVTRPAMGQADAEVTLTAKVQAGDYWAYGMAPAGPMPEPAWVEKTFRVTVPAVTQEETGAAQALVDEALALFTLDNVTVRGTETKADLMAIAYHLNDVPYNWNYVDELPGFREAYRAIQIQWTSTNPGITKVDSGVTVSRTAQDQTGDIVLTLSYNGATARKTFATKVLAFTEADARAEMDDLNRVKDALTFDVIKKENTDADAVTGDLAVVQSGMPEENRVAFSAKKAYHVPGANITWTSSNPDVIRVKWNGLQVTRPEQDVQVILTATLESVRFKELPGVTTVTKELVVTVSGTEEKPAPQPDPEPTPDPGPSDHCRPSRPAPKPVPAPDRFDDVSKTDWFYDDVNFVVERELFMGTAPRTFSPQQPMTRAMLVTVLYRLAGSPAIGTAEGFTDVAADAWYAPAVAWAAGHQVVQGVGDSLFAPNAHVTREQMAAILYRYAVYARLDTGSRGDLRSYADCGEISGYAEGPMAWANAEGLITGRSGARLAPQAGATRAEVAAILHRFAAGK